jgi:hypothetical protein
MHCSASYVKFAESAGARVVPVHFDSSPAEIEALLGESDFRTAVVG